MKQNKGNGVTVSGVALTSLLVAAMGSATAGDINTISKGSKAGGQVDGYAAGQLVVKCVGVAKGGENDCGAIDGSHSCAGQSPASVDFSDNEWAYTTLEECANNPKGKFLMKTADGAQVLSKKEFQFKLVTE